MRDACICDMCNVTEKMVTGEYSNRLPKDWEEVNKKTLCPKCNKLYKRKYKPILDKISKLYIKKHNDINEEEECQESIIFLEFIKDAKSRKKKL